MCCPRHPQQEFRITWEQKAPLLSGGEAVTFLQVVCPQCGFPTGVDMMENDTPDM